ncbi:hypothetical protein [Paenibacillus barengoltzii]|jgi:hypothetical protein|uniref:Flagellar protein FliT n=1 Tax=Paenibacillus barengoltzii J12 TaxID=935846 RepID=A0ABY1LUV6_9BACL|nr:hypothetical protein [Paenibacillus barengoltzii]SME94912.1 hypothetical protein SAMN02744124_00402 [Paenibacillus barengoltzii J12]
MKNPHNMVITAEAMVEITRQYLFEIQSNQDWSENASMYIEKQAELVSYFHKQYQEDIPFQDKVRVQELLRKCYQLELQINHEITRQHAYVSEQLRLLRKGSDIKSKYEVKVSSSGMMFDTFN